MLLATSERHKLECELMTIDIAAKFSRNVAAYPFFFHTLFGDGSDGDHVATNQSDVGHLLFGAKQYQNLTIDAGVTWTQGKGTSSGALIFACRGKLTLAGTINAAGEDPTNSSVAGASAGGSSSGGGAGAPSAGSANGAGLVGSAATRYGWGASYGGARGARAISSGSQAGNVPFRWVQDNSGAFSNAAVIPQDQWVIANGIIRSPGIYGFTTGSGTAGASGTSQPVAASGNYGPWISSGVATLNRTIIPGASPGCSGGATGATSQEAYGGAGGGAAGVVIIEADTIELVAGYSLLARGGHGANGYSSNGTTAVAAGGSPGDGGIVWLICRRLIGSTAGINISAGNVGIGVGTAAVSGIAGIAGQVLFSKVS